MTAEMIARALGGRKTGGSWMARCPAHNDQNPSLSIGETTSGKILVHCHAGCDQRLVIAVLRQRGLWQRKGLDRISSGVRRPDTTTRNHRGEAARTRVALGIWHDSKPPADTLVEIYLSARGLALPLTADLRFHAGLKHPSGGKWPAMVALVRRGTDGTPLGIHRTFLAQDGSGKAPVEPTKMMLGRCRGGAVRLSGSGDELAVGEGIETCLAVIQATGSQAWAALSCSGLRGLDLPASIGEVLVLADGDKPGEAASRDCARRWKREGHLVRIANPPQGLDFNDLLLGDASHLKVEAA
jgi:putative DNA primase/helicase